MRAACASMETRRRTITSPASRADGSTTCPPAPSEASGAGLRRASGSRSWSTEPNTTVAAARAAGNAADHQLPNTGGAMAGLKDTKTLSENNCTNLGRGSVRWMRECQALPGEVQGVGVDIDGARAADLGGYGSQGGGARGHHRPHACDGGRVFPDSTPPPGAAQEVATCPRPPPPSRWR